MIRCLFRGVVTSAAACALFAASSAPAHAQAWVPEPGTGSVSLDYQVTQVKYHLFAGDMTAFGGDGVRLDMGKIGAQSEQLVLDYGVMRNLGFSASIASVGAKYRGNLPEGALDDGKFHGTLQDASLGARYMVPWQGFAITPTLALAFPTHEYEHHGHVAVGKGNKSFNAGIAVGRTLTPWAPNVWLQGGYTRDFVQDVQQWGLDVNAFSSTVGWFVLPQLSVSGYFTYLGTEDGIDWYSDDFTAPGVDHNHDRAAKTLARRAGGTLGYQRNASMGLFVNIGGIVSGANTHDGISYTVGTNWSFVSPFAR